jgi:two-component system OmpR family sensor kinase
MDRQAMKPWTIRNRLIQSLMILIGAFWIVGVVAAGLVVRHELDEVFDSALRETTGQIIPLALQEYDLIKRGQTPAADHPPFLKAGRGHVHYLLRAQDGTVLVRSDGAPESAALAPLKTGFTNQSGFRYFTRSLKRQQLWIQVAQELKERSEAAHGPG